MSTLHQYLIFRQGNASTVSGADKLMASRQLICRIIYGIILIMSVNLLSATTLAAKPLSDDPTFMKIGSAGLSPIVLNGRKDSFERYLQDSAKNSSYTDLSLTHQRQSTRLNIKTHVDAKYLDSASESLDSHQAMKIKKLYLDASIPKHSFSARLGRQSFKMAGTPYPVDGLAVSYKLFKQQKIKLLAGYPQIDEDAVEVNTEKSLYGISTESDKFAKYWKTDTYAYEQKISGITDIQVMGSRLSYTHNKHHALIQMDMDSENRKSLNTHFAYQWTPSKSHYFKLTLDTRKPKAAMGQSITALDELVKTMSTEEIQLIKKDDSAVYRSGSFTWGKQLMDKFFLKSEFSASTLSQSTNENAFISNSYFLYNLEVNADNLFWKDDKNTLSLRYLDHNTTQLISLTYSNRRPVDHHWHANVLIEAYWQKFEQQSQTIKLNPLLKFQYNKKDNNKLDIDIGLVRYNHQSHPVNAESNDLFINLSYTGKLPI